MSTSNEIPQAIHQPVNEDPQPAKEAPVPPPAGPPPTAKKESNNKKKKSFKIIVIGDTGVGKTCLTYRFCSGKFPTTPTDATIGVDFREKLVTLESNEQVSYCAYSVSVFASPIEKDECSR